MNFFGKAFLDAFNLIFRFDAELYFVVWTSIKISMTSVFLASILCIPLAVVFSARKFPGKSFLQSLLNTLMAMPTVVVGLFLFGILSRQGPLGGWGLLYTQTAMVMGQFILIFPIILNLAIAAANTADPRIKTTSIALGASKTQQVLLFMKEVRFAMMAAIVAGFGRAIGEVGVAMMLGGNIEGYTRTMTTAIALETSKGEFEFALALGMLLLLVAFLVNSILERFQKLHK
ncbi:MAG TPA: ABC transporter permease [Gammaproteobacteria bacterium]|nr:ABC transporter permease [Gammaproteobacteria bacterium]